MREPDWRAIADEVPGLRIRSVSRLGEGWTAVAYLVNEELVFKLLKRASEWQQMDAEIAFLAYARDHLPLPVPEHLYQVRDSSGAPNGYAVYRHLPGSEVKPSALSPRARASLAAELGTFLRALHDLPPGPVEHLLPREDERAVAIEYWNGAKEAVAPRLSSAEARRLDEMFARHVEDAENFAGPPRILHADLSVDHILQVDDRITGIIDWEDVNLGDADYDFSYLYLYEGFGEAFVRDVARHYGHRDPDRLLEKAQYYTVVDQVGTILHGGDRALPGDEAASWVRLHQLLGDR